MTRWADIRLIISDDRFMPYERVFSRVNNTGVVRIFSLGCKVSYDWRAVRLDGQYNVQMGGYSVRNEEGITGVHAGLAAI